MPSAHQPGRAFIRTEHAVASVLAETDDLARVLPAALASIGETLGWSAGSVFEIAPDAGEMTCSETWRAPGADADAFERVTRDACFAPGEGLPGRVWSTGEPAWISDLARDEGFPRRREAARAGLRSAFCFPIRGANELLGAIELLDREPREHDASLLATMTSIGGQIGQFLVRRRAQEALRYSDEVRRAMLASALDCVITIDERGRVLEWNAAAERVFGRPAADAVDGELAELIVPPDLRERHRDGLRRYLATGRPTVLDRRVETTGMRADGSEFPVELAITRVRVPGTPRFTAYLRDITDRKRSEAELRGSRARLVEAAYAERRRIERDLHDGTQQRLVSVALGLRLGRARLETDPGAALELIDEAIDELAEATAELRELARGIHPAVLTQGGLRPALAALVERARTPSRLVEAPAERLPTSVESAAYFVVAEALTNVDRYAEATSAEVRAVRRDDRLVVEIADDGCGGADAAKGTGLRGLGDRVGALDGTLAVDSPAGGGTALRVELPCAS